MNAINDHRMTSKPFRNATLAVVAFLCMSACGNSSDGKDAAGGGAGGSFGEGGSGGGGLDGGLDGGLLDGGRGGQGGRATGGSGGAAATGGRGGQGGMAAGGTGGQSVPTSCYSSADSKTYAEGETGCSGVYNVGICEKGEWTPVHFCDGSNCYCEFGSCHGSNCL